MSQSASQSDSGINFDSGNANGDTWIIVAVIAGALALLGLGWLLTKKGN